MSVTTHVEDSFCDSKPEKHCAHAFIPEKNMDDLAVAASFERYQ